jgi:hypothetical protein
MAICMIGYDLHPSSEGEGEYEELFAAIETIGSGYWDCLESTWLVITERTPTEIRDELKQHLKEGDRLLVLRCGDDGAWLGFKDDCRTWLEDRF